MWLAWLLTSGLIMQLRGGADTPARGQLPSPEAVRISSSQSGSQARTVLSIASRQRPKNRGGRPSPSSLCSRAAFQKIGYKQRTVNGKHGEKALEDRLLAISAPSRAKCCSVSGDIWTNVSQNVSKSAVYHSPAGRGSGWRQRDRDKISWCGPQGTFAGQAEAGRIERIRRAAGKIAIILHKAVFKQRSGVVFVQQRFQHHGVRREG